MKRLRELVKKTWVYVIAAALITGSSSAMALVLSSNVTAKAASNVVPISNITKTSIQPQNTNIKANSEYSLIDLSKNVYNNKEKLKEKLKLQKGLTEEQIESQCNSILSAQVPGDKDISAEQAAASSAAVISKAFGEELSGYTAEASFMRSTVPNSDMWSVIFHPANENINFSKAYIADINSVTGTVVNATFTTDSSASVSTSTNLSDPAWTEKAKQSVSALLPKDVSISSSSVVASGKDVGVTVICNLSNGSAYAVRVAGENKDVKMYLFFPNGYDGSFDKVPDTKTVG